ncbi:MAG: class I SAM-dependent methyltransferase [Acidobacteriota bacterium]
MEKERVGLIFTDYEGRDYEKFWRGPAKEYLDKLERAIVTHALEGGDSIVEVGAGFGRLGGCYLAKYRSVSMVEPASNLRTACAKAYGNSVVCYDASVYDLPFSDQSFNAVLMVRVLHHLGSPERALAELNRILKPGGQMIFSYSNKRNLKRVLLFLAGRAKSPFSLDAEPYHRTFFGHHPRYITALLTRAGFRIEEQYGVGVVDKVVGSLPFLLKVMNPSLLLARVLGGLRIAPYQFVVAVKTR